MPLELGNYYFFNIDAIAKQTLCIDDLGIELRRKEDNYYFNNAARDYQGYLFQYTLEGHGIFECQGTRYQIHKGKAFFIAFPEDSRYYFAPDSDVNYHWTFFYLHFSGPVAEAFFNRYRELSGPVAELPLDSEPIGLFFELYEVLRRQGQLERYVGSEWLYRFLISLLRTMEFTPAGNTNPHVSKAVEWIKENYTKQINLEHMCQEIGVSYPHLTRQFCKEQGISPVQFMTHLRLERAMQLLLGTELPIEKIAQECGFSCANYFTKVYKKVLHITPGECRRQRKH